MKKSSVLPIISVLILGLILFFGSNGSGGQLGIGGSTSSFASIENGAFSFSPNGIAGGLAIPASCESQYEHNPGECTTCGGWSGCSASCGGGTQTQTCTRVDGSTYNNTQSCNTQACPPTVDLWGPSTVEVPNPINLGWNSTNANSCNASNAWSGGKSTSGSESVSKPRGNYTFNLSCSGPGGQAQDSQNVNVIQVPHCTFSSDPTSIILPETATLSWDCQYPGGGSSAGSCTIDQGIGSVSSVSGSTGVHPPVTTSYTLNCSGLDGSRSFTTTVGVGFIPKLKEILPK